MSDDDPETFLDGVPIVPPPDPELVLDENSDDTERG